MRNFLEYGRHPDGTIDYSNIVNKKFNKIGFLHAHSNDRAGEKRRNTQEEWAYGGPEIDPAMINSTSYYGHRGFIRDANGGIILVSKGYDYNTRQNHVTQVPLDFDLYPKIWANDPQVGIKVKDYNSRYSTSNKLIVVEDPRGGDFEVTVEYFIELLKMVTIVEGVIQDSCVWAGNKRLVKG